MAEPSWMFIDRAPDAEWDLAGEIAEAHGGAPDCGWVASARAVLRAFEGRGKRVLDPFAGYGTTLVACALEGAHGVGLELDGHRVALAQARLDEPRLRAMPAQRMIEGNALLPPLERESVDLLVTSVPYFGYARATTRAGDAQLYAARDYSRYLALLREAFQACSAVLREGGVAAVMVENLRGSRGQHVPLAWDAARVLGEALTLYDERVLVYPHEGRAESLEPLHTTRAHEYLLVARKDPRGPSP